jgi:hypothetical protein
MPVQKKDLKIVGHLLQVCIFTTVFHRILDFKNGAGFPSKPLFLLSHFIKIIQNILEYCHINGTKKGGKMPPFTMR